MKKWQRVWLYFVIVYSVLHLIRDVSQDLGIKNLLSTVLVKTNKSNYNVYLNFSTYFTAIIETLLSIFILRRNKFERLGYLTLIIAFIIVVVWSVYYFGS